MNTKKPHVLVILDGFGLAPKSPSNAITNATLPHINTWLTQCPHATLKASGAAVGLPAGIIGNSEVGHLTIGAGRQIKQPLTIINEAISDGGSFFSNPLLISNLDRLAQTGKTLHIMGLLSNAGVHSTINHLLAYIKAAHDHKIKKIVIHAFLDGRDIAPKSAAEYLELLSNSIKDKTEVSLGSIQGRFFAMDRDHNWDRTQASYQCLTQAQDIKYDSWQKALSHYYALNITDEFIPPTQLVAHDFVQSEDAILFFNIRPDRARQLTSCFVQESCPECTPHKIPLLFFMTPVSYGKQLDTIVLFPQAKIDETLKSTLSKNGKSIFCIAETEKYAHITYFFGGKHESVLPGESRMLVPSIKAINYIDHPEMSAEKITDEVILSLKNNPADFYLINYANADMVGHSGDMPATIKALEFLDAQLGKLYEQVVKAMDGVLYITSDHGKAELMIDDKNIACTAHTDNPVPFMVVSTDCKPDALKHMHELADIAPFILARMGLPVPTSMQ